ARQPDTDPLSHPTLHGKEPTPAPGGWPLPRPGRLGRFQILGLLGSGSYGVVCKARDPQLDRLVALKVPRLGSLAPQEAERFLREARSAAQLRHPAIVPVHDVGQVEGTCYLVSA